MRRDAYGFKGNGMYMHAYAYVCTSDAYISVLVFVAMVAAT